MAGALALAGCNTTTFERTSPDGSRVSVTNVRAFWSSESYACTITTNGASLTASKSNVDGAAISAAVEGSINALNAAAAKTALAGLK